MIMKTHTSYIESRSTRAKSNFRISVKKKDEATPSTLS